MRRLRGNADVSTIPDLGNANVGRYDMHIFCRYTSTYICFFNLYEHIINRFFQ